MAERSGFFNAQRLANGNFDRVYQAEEFSQYFANFFSNGVLRDKLSDLQVQVNGTFGVKVLNGHGFIHGYWYENDTERALTLTSAESQARRDAVVLRLGLLGHDF